jgi:hypothetical protein
MTQDVNLRRAARRVARRLSVAQARTDQWFGGGVTLIEAAGTSLQELAQDAEPNYGSRWQEGVDEAGDRPEVSG